MELTDIAMILFSCTAANHLGLVSAIEQKVGIRLPVVNCVKCISFWSTMLYMCMSEQGVTVSFAVSFLNAYLSTWLELGMGYIDTLYIKSYDKIYETSADTTSADTDYGDTTGTLSDL